MEKQVEISIILVTYNSIWEKLKLTLNSIICQKDIAFEIIISDDGSLDNNDAHIKEYFTLSPEVSYTFLSNEENVGTIKNLIRAMRVAKGEYVKMISPGDLLIGEHLLAEWLVCLRKSKKLWSFGNMMYYATEGDGAYRIESHRLQPYSIIQDYETEDIDLIQYSYLVKGQRAGGPSILALKELCMEYMNRLSVLIKYAEDFSYDLMILDGVMPLYYQKNVVLYEFCTGISSGTDPKWVKVMKEEDDIFYSSIGKTLKILSLKYDRKFEGLYSNYVNWKRRSSLYFDINYLTEKMYAECCEAYIDEIKKKAENKRLWVYGAGIAGRIVKKRLEEERINVNGFIDIRHEDIKKMDGVPVIGIEELNLENLYLVITLLEYDDAVVKNIEKKGIAKEDYIYIYANRTVKQIINKA